VLVAFFQAAKQLLYVFLAFTPVDRTDVYRTAS